jgi:hypothetical protein
MSDKPTLTQTAKHQKAVDRAIARLGDCLPKEARMWVVCRERCAKYTRPCFKKDEGWKKYRVPDDCPYLETCTNTLEMRENAAEALVIALAKNRSCQEEDGMNGVEDLAVKSTHEWPFKSATSDDAGPIQIGDVSVFRPHGNDRQSVFFGSVRAEASANARRVGGLETHIVSTPEEFLKLAQAILAVNAKETE